MAVEFKESPVLQAKLDQCLAGLAEKDDVHVSIVDLTSDEPQYAGYQDRRFVYPASLYKLYVLMAILAKMKAGELSLVDTFEVAAHNVRPLDLDGFADERPALQPEQKVSVLDLFDLIATRSDNTAANVAIDLLGRPYINAIIRAQGWGGSEVTRKFLPRPLEDTGYKTHQEAPPTTTCTRHLAEFMYLMETGELIDGASSSFLETHLSRQLDGTKLRRGLPKRANFSHKTGWCGEADDHKFIWTTGDCGVVTLGDKQLVVACIVNLYGRKGRAIARYIGRGLRRLL